MMVNMRVDRVATMEWLFRADSMVDTVRRSLNALCASRPVGYSFVQFRYACIFERAYTLISTQPVNAILKCSYLVMKIEIDVQLNNWCFDKLFERALRIWWLLY